MAQKQTAPEGSIFTQNTIVHREGADSEWYHPGDTVPEDLDMTNINPAVWGSSMVEEIEYLDNYDTMKVAVLQQIAKDREIDLEGDTRKDNVIAKLRAADVAEGSGGDDS